MTGRSHADSPRDVRGIVLKGYSVVYSIPNRASLLDPLSETYDAAGGRLSLEFKSWLKDVPPVAVVNEAGFDVDQIPARPTPRRDEIGCQVRRIQTQGSVVRRALGAFTYSLPSSVRRRS